MKSPATDSAVLDDLFRLLEDWRILTLAETDAIQASDWDGLERVQLKKAGLQPLIEEAETAVVGSPNLSEQQKSAEKNRLRQFASDLVALETKNRDLLSDRLAQADDELKSSNKAISSLRNLQQAYGTTNRSFWQAYS